MHSSWINQCEWFLNIMKDPASMNLWKLIVIFAITPQVKMSCGDSGVGNLGFGRRWSGAPQELSPAWIEVCFSEGKQYLCWEDSSSSAINQALKQDTSSYHHITPYSQKRAGLFLGPEAPHISSEDTSQSKLHRSLPLPRFSKAWFIVLLRPLDEPKQP